MTVTESEDGYTISQLDPPDFTRFGGDDRTRFYGWVVEIGLREKDRELAKGLDRDGEELRDIKPETRKHRRSAMTKSGKGDPKAPPLIPGWKLSRVRSLLTGKAFPDRAEFWWGFDAHTGASFARILEAQKDQGRDVFGLSPGGLLRVRAQSWARWDKFRKGIHPERARDVPTARQGAGRPPKMGVFRISKLELGGPSAEKSKQAIQERRVVGMMGPEEWAAYWAKAGKAKTVARAPMRPVVKPEERGMLKRAPAKPRAPKKPPAAPRTLEQDITHALETRKQGENTLQAVARVLEAHARPGPSGTFHGMAEAEEFRTVRYQGVNWHFTGPIEPTAPVVSSIRNMQADLAKHKIPDRIMKATHDVYFTSQRNQDDARAAKKYDIPGMISHATGGDQKVVVYNRNNLGLAQYLHESGHNLAHEIYGGQPTPHSDYGQIIARGTEPPVSDYARKSPGEDFAEAVRLYGLDPERMRKEFPERFAIIDRIVKLL
jgi:hypothetical protein